MSEKRIKIEYDHDSQEMTFYRWESENWKKAESGDAALGAYINTPLEDADWDEDFFLALADAVGAGKRDTVRIYFSADEPEDEDEEDIYDTLEDCLNACDEICDDFTFEKITFEQIAAGFDLAEKDARNAMGIIFGALAESFGMRIQLPTGRSGFVFSISGLDQGLSAEQKRQMVCVNQVIRGYRNSQKGYCGTIAGQMGKMMDKVIACCYRDFGYSSAERFEAALCKAWGCRPGSRKPNAASAIGAAGGTVSAAAGTGGLMPLK